MLLNPCVTPEDYKGKDSKEDPNFGLAVYTPVCLSAHAHQRSLVTEFILIRDFADAEEVKTVEMKNTVYINYKVFHCLTLLSLVLSSSPSSLSFLAAAAATAASSLSSESLMASSLSSSGE